MRTLFNTGSENVVALEGMPVEEIIALEEISDEEAQLIAQSAIKYAMEADSILMETERITDIVISLEEAVLISGTVQVATEAELAFLETIGNLATAGTDVDPERIVPSMESYVGTTISLEGLKETIANIWEKIKVFIKKVWEALKNFYNETMREIPRLKANLLALQKKIPKKTTSDKSAKEKITISTGVDYFEINGKVLDTELEINNAFGQLADISKWVFGPYLESVIMRGDLVEKTFSQWEPDLEHASREALMVKLQKDLLSSSFPKIPGGHELAGHGPFGHASAIELMGNVHLVNDTRQAGGLGEHFAASDFWFSLTRESCQLQTSGHFRTEEIKLLPFSSGAMNVLIDDMVSVLDIFQKYQYGTIAKKLEASYISLAKTADSISVKVSEQVKKTEGTETSNANHLMSDFRGFTTFNTTYAKWSKDPAVPMMRHVISTIKALAMVMSKSLSSYSKVKGEGPDTFDTQEFDIHLKAVRPRDRSGIQEFHVEHGDLKKYQEWEGKTGRINGDVMKITKVSLIQNNETVVIVAEEVKAD
jgi:hypothetical protein